ncbi:ceramide synthase 1-like [Oscarella lobularis]|uniref:ceramide synthase 1-like n=1 Tax=Oscarella lobularis TaxID=121494 RepID=UPI0033133C33
MFTFIDALRNITKAAWDQWELTKSRNALTGLFDDLRKHGTFTQFDFACCLFLAVFLTIMRYAVDRFILRPLTKRLKLPDEEAQKFPESAWKGSYYVFSWSYTLYLVYTYGIFFNPQMCWTSWESRGAVPNDVYGLYISQLGFYVHSFYATFFMDDIRKDFLIMVAHHVISIFLIGFSLAVRYHFIGVLLIFLHDCNDVLLEYSKCMLYLKKQGNKECPHWELRANIGFGIFMVTWVILRIYYYFYSILYNAGYLAPALIPSLPFYFFFNIMLWLIYFMNIYWYYFVILVALRIFTGKGAKDTRENEEKNQKKET